MLRISLLAPFAVAALIAGCGSSSSTSSSVTSSSAAAATSTSSATSAGGNVSLVETEFKITPATPAVSKTGTITITVKNSGKFTHALAVQTPAGLVHTAHIAPGATATLTVNATKAGKYTFYCPIGQHRMLGMQGTLVVGGAGAATPAPASSTSSSSGYSY